MTRKNNSRTKTGLKVGIIGAICNLFLASAKLAIGIISSSISIQSDAINNFGDVIASGAVAFSFIISGKKADKEHPYGHGRIEYIISFIIAFIIVFAGIEFFISSIKKIIRPEPIEFSWIFFAIILFSIFVKIGMFFFYKLSNKKINSPTIKAAKMDALQDVLITSITIISFTFSGKTSFPIDGIAGAAISVFVLINGLKLIRETINNMMGGKQDIHLSALITAKIMNYPNILGVHDLLLHDYGPNNSIASIHAELPSTLSLSAAHDIIDKIEKEIKDECKVDLVIHIDPVDMDSEDRKKYKILLRTKLADISPLISFHDFKIDKECNKIIFELVLPYNKEYKYSEKEVIDKLNNIDFGKYQTEYTIEYK